jgi:hypothetical protein
VRAVLDGLTPALDDYFTKSHKRVIQLAGVAPDGATKAFKLMEHVLEQKHKGRPPALDNFAGIVSRDYDFRLDGTALPQGHQAAALHQGSTAARCPHTRGIHPASTAAAPLQGIRERR